MSNYQCFLILTSLVSLAAGYPDAGDVDHIHRQAGHARQSTEHQLMQPVVHVRAGGNRRAASRNHFDSTHFCEDFTLGKAKERPSVTSFVLLRDTVNQEMAVMRCVAAVEILALPHNILQDFRWSFKQIRRTGSLSLRQLFLLPFTIIQTIASLPLTIFKQMGKTIMTILSVNKGIYSNYG